MHLKYNMRAACPTNILSYMHSTKICMHLTPTQCVLHVLIITYNPRFLPNSLRAFGTHTMPAECPTNIQSSMTSA